MKYFGLILLLISSQSLAGTTRSIDADIIKSSNHTKTWTPPSATDTLVGRASTDTLTNKTISGSANTLTNISLTSSVTGILPEVNGGTNQSTYTLGDFIYASATNTLSKLAGNTTTTKKYLSQTGTGTVSAAMVWSQPAFSELSGSVASTQMPALTGDVTTTAGAVATSIGTNKVANTQLAQMTANTIKGNNTGSTANAADLSVTQATAMLNAFVGDSGSGGTKGLVPAPSSGDAAAGKFLKADGTFQVPSGGGGSTTIIVPPIIDVFASAGTGTYNKRYTFIITSGSASAGATYTNNSITFTVYATVASATQVVMSGNGVPTSSGTLTKATGTGDSTITFSQALAPLYLRVRMAGAGGGGAASVSNGGTPSGNGTSSLFGSSFLTAGGGTGPNNSGGGGGGAGGISTIATGANGIAINGGKGGGSTINVPGATFGNYTMGGSGGANAFGGGGSAGAAQAPGGDAQTNSGGGGGGAGGPPTVNVSSGAGGGAGGYIDALIGPPATGAVANTYSYTVGAHGAGETASGTNSQAGGNGADGIIEVTGYYQ